MKLRDYLFACLILASSAFHSQTIPNGSFETWNNSAGYPSPANWTTNNVIPFFTGSQYGVTQELPGTQGNYYCKIACAESPEGSAFPSYIITGAYDALSEYGSPGFPINAIPSALSCQFRSSISGDDFARVSCFLTRINDATGMRDTIATGVAEISQSEQAWTNLDIPISLLNSETPDTCVIIIRAGAGNNPQIGNYIDIDDLHFTGGAASLDEGEIVRFHAWPNPMTEMLMIDLSMMDNTNDVTLFDMQGRLIEQLQLTAAQVMIDVAHLQTGAYLLRITNRRGSWIQPLLKK